jgi:hypothetical protein
MDHVDASPQVNQRLGGFFHALMTHALALFPILVSEFAFFQRAAGRPVA